MNKKQTELRDFYILWSTQSLSQLGSSITAMALTLWLYDKTGSSLGAAALAICTYTPYVVMSIFAGAFTDRFNKKKLMLLCDFLAALGTLFVFVLYKTDALTIWHLYGINVLSGLMNTVQQPASEVAYTMIVSKEDYLRISSMKSLSRSVISVLHPLIASSLYSFAGLDLIVYIDLLTFLIAFLALAFAVKIPEITNRVKESTLDLAKEGLRFLKKNQMVFNLLLFLSGVNLIAYAFQAALKGYVLPNPKGGNNVFGIVTAISGIAMMIGSLMVSVLPKPKDRVRVVFLTMLFSLGSENFILAFSREPVIWCIAQFTGWILVPVMSANLEMILRNTIPVELQGRVYACRNTFQFFTIPIGLFLGGFLVDQVCEPVMAEKADSEFLTALFGTGKSSGAAMVMFILGIAGTLLCIIMGSRLKKYHYSEN